MVPYTISLENQVQIVKYLQVGARVWTNLHPESEAAPWENEPVEPQTGASPEGLPWCVMRGPLGAWNGYVGVPPGHLAFVFSNIAKDTLEVHGGITYTREANTPESAAPNDFLWFGFDCAHVQDITPGSLPPMETYAVYRTLEFALAETLSLAKQLGEFQPPTSAELLEKLRTAEPTLLEQYLAALEAESVARRGTPEGN